MNRTQPLLVAMLMVAACGQEDRKTVPPSNELPTVPAAPEAAAEVPAGAARASRTCQEAARTLCVARRSEPSPRSLEAADWKTSLSPPSAQAASLQ